MAKIIPMYSPKDTYQRHIARANHIILTEVVNNLKPDNNEQQ